MNTYRLASLCAIAMLSAPTLGFAADTEAGLAAVTDLGGINGTALACSDMKTAARARELMLAHAPKTPRFGAAYEEATNAAFNAQTSSGKPCADAVERTAQLNQLALWLGETLPITPRQ